MEAVLNFSLVLPHPTFTHHAVCPGRREFVPSKTASAHQERQAKTKRTTAVARLVMVTLGKFFDWRKARSSSSRRRSSAGTGPRLGCSGAGNHKNGAAHHCPGTSVS